METLYRLISGLTAGFIALFAPIGPLVACAMAFIGIDFLSGVAASRAAARRKGHTWYFESCEAWRTVLKLGLTVTAIAMVLADRQLCLGLHAAERGTALHGFYMRRGVVVVPRKCRTALRCTAVPLAAPVCPPPYPKGGGR